MKMWEFKFGDVFKAGDPLSLWLCTLGQAFNDMVYANVQVEEADTEWKRLYYWRLAMGHYSETCLHLERMKDVPEVAAFLNSKPSVKAAHDETLRRYDELRGLANRVRNETVFHYPYDSGQRALAKAITDLEDEKGTMGAYGSTKVRDMRLGFADDAIARMIFNAAGGDEDAFAAAASSLGEAVAEFGRFANQALDAFFADRLDVVKRTR